MENFDKPKTKEEKDEETILIIYAIAGTTIAFLALIELIGALFR